MKIACSEEKSGRKIGHVRGEIWRDMERDVERYEEIWREIEREICIGETHRKKNLPFLPSLLFFLISPHLTPNGCKLDSKLCVELMWILS